MNFKNLVILDLKDNLEVKENNCEFINLSSGSINFTNSKKVFIKKYLDRYYQSYKKKLIFNLKIKIKLSSIKFLGECEVFNLRNDKELFLNKLIVILIIKKFIIKNYKSVKIITDDYFTYKVFKKMNLVVNYFGKTKKVYDFSILKILKFYLKTLVVLTLDKFLKKQVLRTDYKNLYLSMYPNFYDKGKETFFKKEKDLKVNFLLTDETHLNASLKDIKDTLNKFRQKNTVNLESFINFADIIKLILLIPYNLYKNFFSLNRKLVIEKCDFSDFFKYYINISLVNRFKLEIYKKSFLRLKKNFPILKISIITCSNIVLVFFLPIFLKIILKNPTHWISAWNISDNIMWLDLIKNNKNYLPHKIVALNKICAGDYKKVTKKRNIYLNRKIKKQIFF